MKANENDILEAVYKAGAEDGMKSYKKEMKKRVEQAIAEEEAIKSLFTIQRMLGFGMVLCAFALMVFGELFGACVVLPLAGALLLSNHLIITDPGDEFYDA